MAWRPSVDWRPHFVPASKCDAVITQFHQSLVAGHWGIPRVTALLQRHFVMHHAYMRAIYQTQDVSIEASMNITSERGKPEKLTFLFGDGWARVTRSGLSDRKLRW